MIGSVDSDRQPGSSKTAPGAANEVPQHIIHMTLVELTKRVLVTDRSNQLSIRPVRRHTPVCHTPAKSLQQSKDARSEPTTDQPPGRGGTKPARLSLVS